MFLWRKSGRAVLFCLLLLPQQLSGQGLILDASSRMGASNRLQNMMQAYQAAKSKAQDMQQRFASMTAASCKGSKSASLCGSISTASASEQEALSLMAAPDFYDARLKQHTGGVSVVREPGDQGADCGACVAFAVAAAAESAAASRLHQDVESFPRLSPRSLFFCHAQGGRPSASCSEGWKITDALGELEARQPTPEQCMPWQGYKADPVYRCRSTCDKARVTSLMQALQGRFAGTFSQPLNSVAAIQRHIRQWGAVITRFNLNYDDLMDFAKRNPAGIYKGTSSAPTLQGHAVVLVGYNNAEQWWIVKQSYGPGFAEGGFMKVRYGSTGVIDPTFTMGVVFQPASPRSRASQLASYVSPDSDDQNCFMYQVQQGDFVERVAFTFAVKVEQLLGDNAEVIPKSNPGAFLRVGSRLRVCGGPQPPSLSGGGAPKQPASGSLPTGSAKQVTKPVPTPTQTQDRSIPGLVAMLGSSNAAQQQGAANDLASIAFSVPNKAAEILAAGAVPPLVRLLRSPDPGVQHPAAKALRYLAAPGSSTDVAPKKAIINAGALPPLVELLGSTTLLVQANAVAALANIAYASADTSTKLAVANAGAVPPAVRLLDSQDGDVVQSALRLLNNVMRLAPQHAQLVVNSGGVPRLVQLLRKKDANMMFDIIWPLVDITNNAFNNKKVIVDGGGVPVLVEALSNREMRVRHAAAALLANLSSVRAYGSAIAKAGAVPPLVQLLGSSITDAQQRATTTLGNIAWASPADRQAVIDAGAVPALQRLAKSSDAAAAARAEAALKAVRG